DDSCLDNVTLEFGTILDEFAVLVLCAKLHHVFDARPVVPASIEHNNLAGSWEVLHVALWIQLRLLPVGCCPLGHQVKNARADPLQERFDGASLARCVAPFEQNDYTKTFVHDPILQST